MANNTDEKLLIKHLANGSLADNLCVVCLSPLEINKYESIFKIICKEDKVFCIADVLEILCQIRFQNSDYYNICTDCLTAATTAYKFYLTVKQTNELLNLYTDKLLSRIEEITINPETTEHILHITLHKSKTKLNIDNKNNEKYNQMNLHTDKTILNHSKHIKTDKISTNNDILDSDSEEIIVSIEDDKAYYYKVETDGSLTQVKDDEEENDREEEDREQTDQEDEEEFVMIVNEKKERKKRDPLNYVNCSRCPVKYRFISKLRDHMKSVHNVDIFYCKICRIISEQKDEYNKHLLTHTGEYQCRLCNAVYKKERTLLTHMEWHERTKNIQQTERCNICEICGVLLETEDELQHHYTHKHIKKYTCYYCGRMYKGEKAFNLHIIKHEDKTKSSSSSHDSARLPVEKPTKRSVCTTCGKDFVDERSLLWHQRLHDNNKPYACDKCDRRFVSAPRRNQHALCAHTPPARRCPLCPALFHLRSMVNTHVKKVHLKTHKRRNRTAKYENVLWKTKTVPIEELSISIQDEILELQAKDGAHINDVVMNET